MARKIKAVIVQPVHDRYGEVVFQPGTYLDENDSRLVGLPAAAVRYEVITEPDPEPEVLSELDQLRLRAEELGIKADGRWSAARLQQEITAKGDVL